MATEIATAFVSLVPSFKGGQAAITKEMSGAGAQGGRAFGGAFGGSLKKVVAPLVGVFAAVGVGKFVGDVVGDFKTMEQNIIAGTGASGQALRGLSADARQIATQVPASFADAGSAVADWNTALGLTGKPLQDLSAQTLQLAKVTGVDLSTLIKANSRLLGDWGIASEDAALTQDKLLTASQATGVGVDRLSQLMVKFGSPLRQLGFDFDTSAALISKFEKEGVNTELVMGSMRIALGKMARDGEPAQETLARVTDEIANAGSTSEANALALELFGARAGPDMAAAIREGRFEVGDLIDTIAGGEGAIASAEAGTRTFGDQWQVLKNKVLAPLEPVIKAVMDALIVGVGWLISDGIPAVKAFGEFISRNRTPILIVAGIITAIYIPAIIRAGVAAVVSAGQQVAAFAAARVAGAASSVAMAVNAARVVVGWVVMGTQSLIQAGRMALAWLIAMGPIALIIAAVIGLVAIIILNWDTIKQWTVKIFTAVWNFLKGLWDKVVAFIGRAIGFVKDIFFRFHPVGIIIKNWDPIWSFVKGLWDKVLGFIKKIPGRIRGFLSGMWDVVKSGARSAMNAAIGLINGAIGGLNVLIGTVNKIPGVSIPRISPLPMLAQGGIVRATPGGVAAILAEGGQDEVVAPLSKLQSIIGGWMSDEAAPASPSPLEVHLHNSAATIAHLEALQARQVAIARVGRPR